MISIDTGAMLARVSGNATWAAVRDRLTGERLAVSALGTPRSETVALSVQAGEISHRSLAGVELVTRGGERISSGGRTLKDVVGYDLAGLVLGSGDRLGTIAGVTLRLEPAGARTPAEAGPGPWRGDAGIDIAAAFGG